MYTEKLAPLSHIHQLHSDTHPRQQSPTIQRPQPAVEKSLWRDITRFETRPGIFKQSMGARNRRGIGLSYRPARLHRLAEFIPWIDSWAPFKNTGSVCRDSLEINHCLFFFFSFGKNPVYTSSHLRSTVHDHRLIRVMVDLERRLSQFRISLTGGAHLISAQCRQKSCIQYGLAMAISLAYSSEKGGISFKWFLPACAAAIEGIEGRQRHLPLAETTFPGTVSPRFPLYLP